MADEIKLTQEELDSMFPPADPAKYQEWYEYQCDLGERDFNDPNTVWIPHEEVFRGLEEKRKEWRERAQRERNVA